ncbi:MAG: hypothetical protein AAF694_06865 [Bacteroidota bacterium]
MGKIILLLPYMLGFNRALCQENQYIQNHGLLCYQIQKARKYLRKQQHLRSRPLRFDPFIRNGYGYSNFSTEYTAYKLQVPNERESQMWYYQK